MEEVPVSRFDSLLDSVSIIDHFRFRFRTEPPPPEKPMTKPVDPS